jgi:hypothetical protein
MGRNRQLWGKIFSFAGLIDDEWLYRAREFNAAAPKMVLFGKRVTGRRAIARVTRHRRVAQRRNASPGCSARPRLFIEFHLTREGLGGYWAEKLRSWTMRKSARFCPYHIEQNYFFGVLTDFHAADRTYYSGRGLVALVNLPSLLPMPRVRVTLSLLA